jgi:hypothetical protein
VHPQFDRLTFRFDYAVIQLHQQVQSNYTLIRLNNDTSFPISGQEVHVLGWGKTSNGDDDQVYADILQEAATEIISNNECAAFEVNGKTSYEDEIYPEMICAWAPGTDACAGDSGGPLISFESGAIQVGIVSWGRSCALYPGVYSRVSSAYDWIRSHVCESSHSPPQYLGCTPQERESKVDDYNQNPGTDDLNDDDWAWGDDDGVSTSTTANSTTESTTLAPVLGTSETVTVEIQLDSYSWETSWFLAWANRTKILEVSSGSYSSTPGMTVNKSVVLPVGGPYSFVIIDSGGNGLCCKDGNETVGWYRVFKDGEDAEEVILVYGAGDFGYRAERYFSLVAPINASTTSDSNDLSDRNQSSIADAPMKLDDAQRFPNSGARYANKLGGTTFMAGVAIILVLL